MNMRIPSAVREGAPMARPRVATRTLVSTDHLRVHFSVSSGRAVVFTFRGFNPQHPQPLEAPGFGQQFFVRAGFDVVAFKCNRNYLFQDVTEEHIATINEALPRYRHRFGYGSSAGGYAAVKFAKGLRMTHALVFSPLIDRACDPRYPKYAKTIAFRHSITADTISRDCLFHVAIDPGSELDMRHLAALEALTEVKRLHYPGFGHGVASELNRQGKLREMTLAVFESAMAV